MAGFDVGAYLPRVLLARGPGAPRHWSVDGTLVFIDISGFTKLSHQLARRGREGAEDLVSTLVRIFTVLLSASDDGGDVIKFGGDALLVSYTGPDHARRACHAAYLAQRVMGVVGNVTLTGARTRLKMSVGIHSGRFDYLLPGVGHQDLVVLGPGVSRVLALEGAADAGQVLISDETAALVPSSWHGARKEPGILLRRAGGVPATGSQILFHSREEEQLWTMLPQVFADRPDLLGAPSDHRRAAMAFIHVTGLDDVGADPAGALAAMDEVAELVSAVAAETGISVLDTDVAKDGYKYFLAAGAPTSLEDPEGRMLRALLRIVGADTQLETRAGCATGRVFAGTVGAPFRCTYAAMGDTTNLAARLCAKAEPGTVLTHAPTLTSSLTQFAHDPVFHVELKGKPDPVPVATVTRVIGQRGRGMAASPFVGRSDELLAIEAAFAGVADDKGAVVEIIGEPGLGKSRLADVALNRSGLTVIRVTGDPYGALVPFQTVRLLLRPLLGLFPDAEPAEAGRRLTEVVRDLVPGVMPFLPLVAAALGAEVSASPMLDELDERFRASVLHDALSDLMAELLSYPVAILVDDAHWVDEASADALAVAFAKVETHPWAVVLTRREGDGGLQGSDTVPTHVVRPEPLGEAEAQALLSEQGPGLRPDQMGAIVGRGGGNPYFLLQLASADGDLPDTVEELIGTRIDGLESSERELLRDAAVLGSRFHRDLYAAATGDPSFWETAQSATLAPFLATSSDGWVTFNREIYREVAYGQLTFRARRQLHREVAEAIEARPRLAGDARLPMLSLHFHQAGLWDRAHTVSIAAGDAAKAAWANEEAVQFYQRALDAGRRMVPHPDSVARVHESIGDVHEVAGRYDAALTAFSACLRASSDPPDRVRRLLKVARMHYHTGSYRAAANCYARARTIAASDPRAGGLAVQAEIDVNAASNLHLQGRNAAGRDLALQAWESTAELPAGDQGLTRIRARAAFIHDTCATSLDGPAANRFGDLPLRMFERIGDHYYAGIVANNLGIQAFDGGSWTEAIRIYTDGARHCQRAGDRVGSAIMDMNIAEILGLQRHTDQAVELLEDALHTFSVHDVTHWYADACAYLGAALLERGTAADVERARDLLTEARELHLGEGSHHSADYVAVKELDLLLLENDLAGTIEAAEELLARSRPLASLHESRVHRALGTAYLRGSGAAPARTHLDRALDLALSVGADHDAALTQLLLAELGDADASGLSAAARETLTGLGISNVP